MTEKLALTVIAVASVAALARIIWRAARNVRSQQCTSGCPGCPFSDTTEPEHAAPGDACPHGGSDAGR